MRAIDHKSILGLDALIELQHLQGRGLAPIGVARAFLGVADADNHDRYPQDILSLTSKPALEVRRRGALAVASQSSALLGHVGLPLTWVAGSPLIRYSSDRLSYYLSVGVV
jgi:hypothetical protein